ncbi:MAG: type II toxin-antitoxin system VapC family toxin [Candidatus Gracilibacteria bacterium]
MMQEYILDSNILIYLSNNKEPKIKKMLQSLRREYFFISTISSIEVLMGAKNEKDLKELNRFIHQFVPIDLNSAIGREAVKLSKKQTKKLKFKDLLIAATAQVEGLTLVTADKDFKKIKGLKVRLVKP